MSKATLKQIWFFMTCLFVMTYLNASSSYNQNGLFMHDIHGVVYQCDTPNLKKEGLCRDYGRVTRTTDGIVLYTVNHTIKHISFNQKPLISKNAVGHEVVEVFNSNEKQLSRVLY